MGPEISASVEARLFPGNSTWGCNRMTVGAGQTRTPLGVYGSIVGCYKSAGVYPPVGDLEKSLVEAQFTEIRPLSPQVVRNYTFV